MKLSRQLRSFGAAFLCAAMVLCNIPTVQAQSIYYGNSGNTPTGNPNNNTSTLPPGEYDSVFGGYSNVADSQVGGNRITVLQARIKNLYGGYIANSGSALNNEINIQNVIVDSGIYGGWVDSGEASGNKVTIEGAYPGSTVNGSVFGGFVNDLGRASNNEVTIGYESRIHGDVVGGHSGALTFNTIQGTTHNNKVTIKPGAIVTGDVYGGQSGSASENIVTIEGSGNTNSTIVLGTIVGGGSENTDALYSQYNQVNIVGDSVIIGNIYGGRVNYADTLGNMVNVTNGSVTGSIYGGNSAGTGNAVVNMVTLNGTAAVDGSIIGGWTTRGDAIGNEVYINGGDFNVYGVEGGKSIVAGNANNNAITIVNARGNFRLVHGGTATRGNASDNTVNLYGGVFDEVSGGSTYDGSATGNTVNLYGGSFNRMIVGGHIAPDTGAGAGGSATGNTVNIFGPIIANRVRILGGLETQSGGLTENQRYDARSGNTLNIATPITIAGIDNFEYYNFYLPAEFTANDTMIAVTNGNGSNQVSNIQDSKAINIEDSKIGIGVHKDSNLKHGDTVILIDEQGGFGFVGEIANDVSIALTDRSDFVDYSFGLTVNDNQLRASVIGASLDSRTDSIPEGFISGLILTNQGADAIAGSAMDSAMTAAHKGPIQGLGAFGSLIAGKSKYDTGSDIDMVGVSAAAGLAIGADFINSSLTFGPFFEYGRAEFDTANIPADGQKVIGDGDSEYFGGGFLLRMDYKDVGLGRYFAEASVRAGRQKNNFSVNLPDAGTFSYSSTSPYYGVHLGYGGSWDVAASTALDIYGKYFLARGGDSSVSMSNGENIDFEAVTSNRIRGGSRLAYVPSDSLAISFGGAYEYEISGETSATMRGHAINAPSLKGGTGIGEVVIGYKPSAESLTSINVGIQGYTGKRQGVTASLFLRF